MKKIILLLSLLALTACGSSETPETITPDITPKSVISGDITLSDNGADVLTGKVKLTDNDSFVLQQNTPTPLGKFSISADGAWQFEPSRNATGLIELTDNKTVTEVISLLTTDGFTHSIILTLHGSNDAPEFNSGAGIDSGEIQAEISAELTGRLLIVDPDADEGGFIEQSATQGAFGSFSIAASGDWSYTITNFASDFVSPEEVFSVTSIDGTEHQVTILVKGLYQRIIKSNTYQIESDELIFNENGLRVYEPIQITSLYEREYIQQAQENSHTEIIYEYDVFSNLKTRKTYRLLQTYRNLRTSETEPEYIENYTYEYLDGDLSKKIKEQNRVDYTTGQAIIDRKIYTEYLFSENKETEQSYKSYYYDEFGENPEYRYYFTFNNIYNDIGKLSEFYGSYLDTDYIEITTDNEGQRLRYQYFYHENKSLEYRLYYRNNINRVFVGIAREESYFYDVQDRVSYILKYNADSELIEDVYVHSAIDYSSPDIEVYNYMDELDILVIYSSTNADYTEAVTTNSARIIQYEDTDLCGDYIKLLLETQQIDVPGCRIKQEVLSSSVTKLPQL